MVIELFRRYFDVWIFGYLDIWIFGDLDIWISKYFDVWILGTPNLLLHAHSEILCGAALPEAFFKKKQVPGGLQLKTVFLELYLNNL